MHGHRRYVPRHERGHPAAAGLPAGALLATNLCPAGRLVLTAAGLPPYPWTGPAGAAGAGRCCSACCSRAAAPAPAAWFFGLAHQATLLHWLFLLDPAKTIPTRALVPIQAIATVLYVSVFYLLVGWAFGRIRDRVGPARALLLLPVLWTVHGALRARGEMGFPWCLSGLGL